MIADRVLARVGAHVREEQKDDARFERIARAEASDAERAALEREAAEDPELAARLEGSRPLDPAFAERLAARLAPSRSAAPPLPFAPRRSRRVAIIAGPLAIAAAMVLFLSQQRGPSLPDLPTYVVSATGEQAMRGPAEPSTRLHVGRDKRDGDARFEVELRPATATPSKVVAYVFAIGALAAAGDEPSPLEAKVEVAPAGAVRITGEARRLAGVRELRIVVGAPSEIGKFDDALARAKSGTETSRVRVIVVPVEVD
jgi:hypothetical protein